MDGFSGASQVGSTPDGGQSKRREFWRENLAPGCAEQFARAEIAAQLQVTEQVRRAVVEQLTAHLWVVRLLFGQLVRRNLNDAEQQIGYLHQFQQDLVK